MTFGHYLLWYCEISCCDLDDICSEILSDFLSGCGMLVIYFWTDICVEILSDFLSGCVAVCALREILSDFLSD